MNDSKRENLTVRLENKHSLNSTRKNIETNYNLSSGISKIYLSL